ncbi:hypothetical protein W97_08790 [Coniosporium apollinis CBS 100218]|uniref:Fork-head domain-containing protein n=1 Tax=Coniosporium apollinis (strain CBS 100218) TaxID=1168221 RepID=R7Z5S2_CONA1|nr:uncharacterized protein W97_08790 [Coniosporium apollinis CBS 100218]EON69530.1 hypothetical protein W97_08790 [Coniosporium apollinis CBS 100218]
MESPRFLVGDSCAAAIAEEGLPSQAYEAYEARYDNCAGVRPCSDWCTADQYHANCPNAPGRAGVHQQQHPQRNAERAEMATLTAEPRLPQSGGQFQEESSLLGIHVAPDLDIGVKQDLFPAPENARDGERATTSSGVAAPETNALPRTNSPEEAAVSHDAETIAATTANQTSLSSISSLPDAAPSLPAGDTAVTPQDLSVSVIAPLTLAHHTVDTLCLPADPNSQTDVFQNGLQNGIGLETAVASRLAGAFPYTATDDQHISSTVPDLTNLCQPSLDTLAYQTEADFYQASVPELQTNTEPMKGFARLDFDDGQFYMTTYSIELGRDVRAERLVRQRATGSWSEGKAKHKRKSSSGDVPQTPVQLKSDVYENACRSQVSESGGIVGADDDSFKPMRRKKSKKSKSTSSSSQCLSRKDSTYTKEEPEFMTVSMANIMDGGEASPPDVAALLPDPTECPLIPIHPPNMQFDSRTHFKAISRRHARISYNFTTHCWEMMVLGRNGAFHDDELYGPEEVAKLHDGSSIQIAGVCFTFRLPNTTLSDAEDREEGESASGRMSFAFENERGESIVMEEDSESESPSPLIAHNHYWDDPMAELDEDPDGDSEDPEEDDEEQDEPAEEQRPVKVKLKLRMTKPAKKPEPKSKKDARKLKTQVKAPAKPPSKSQPKAATKEISKGPAKQPKEATKAPAKKKPKEVAVESVEEPEDAKDQAKATDEIKGEADEDANDKSPVQSTELVKGGRELTPEEAAKLGLPVGTIIPPKRKGPGRPPKDGIMSKREKALLARQAKEAEKARKLGIDPATLPQPVAKPKVSKPRKESDGETNGQKRKEGTEGVDGQAEDGEDGSPSDEKKAAKAAKPARSPSPEMKLEDYSEEQLQRPNANYVVLIHEAISNSKNGAMNLQQIYSAIEHKYPYYRFKTSTNGWQSSVRHNLGQNPAFKRVEKEGKGFLWGVDPTVSIEKERKKRATPPPPPPRPQYPQQMSYPAGQYQVMPPGAHPGMPAYGPYGNQHGQPPRPPPPTHGQPHGLAAPPKTSSYASPYASAPLPSTSQPPPPPHSQVRAPNGAYPPYGPPRNPSYPSQPPPAPSGQQPQYPPRPSHTPPGVPPPPTQSTYTLENLNTTLTSFKEAFLKSAGPKQLAHNERLVDTVIKRILHPRDFQSPPIGEEKQVLDVLNGLIASQHRAAATNAPSAAQPQPPIPQASQSSQPSQSGVLLLQMPQPQMPPTPPEQAPAQPAAVQAQTSAAPQAEASQQRAAEAAQSVVTDAAPSEPAVVAAPATAPSTAIEAVAVAATLAEPSAESANLTGRNGSATPVAGAKRGLEETASALEGSEAKKVKVGED